MGLAALCVFGPMPKAVICDALCEKTRLSELRYSTANTSVRKT